MVAPSTWNAVQAASKRKGDAMAEEGCECIKSLKHQYARGDECQIFDDLIASKLWGLSTQHARNAVQNMTQNILYSAEQGQYDFPPAYNAQQLPYKTVIIHKVLIQQQAFVFILVMGHQDFSTLVKSLSINCLILLFSAPYFGCICTNSRHMPLMY